MDNTSTPSLWLILDLIIRLKQRFWNITSEVFFCGVWLFFFFNLEVTCRKIKYSSSLRWDVFPNSFFFFFRVLVYPVFQIWVCERTCLITLVICRWNAVKPHDSVVIFIFWGSTSPTRQHLTGLLRTSYRHKIVRRKCKCSHVCTVWARIDQKLSYVLTKSYNSGPLELQKNKLKRVQGGFQTPEATWKKICWSPRLFQTYSKFPSKGLRRL